MSKVQPFGSVVVSALAICATGYVYWRWNCRNKRNWITLVDLNQHFNWVSICGIVFQVESNLVGVDGIYGSIGGHDATIAFCGRIYKHSNENSNVSVDHHVTAALDCEIHDDLTESEVNMLKSTLITFKSKYRIVGQLTDLFQGPSWDKLRSSLDDHNTKPTCPLGFGSKRQDSNALHGTSVMSSSTKWIIFDKIRYDVSNSPSFSAPSPFAVYVGHDITYALAIGSVDPNDFAKAINDDTQLTFPQQKTLAQYRQAFQASLPVLEVLE